MSRGKAVNQLILIASILLFLLLATNTSFAKVHQEITVALEPEQHRLSAQVTLEFESPKPSVEFWLNSNLKVTTPLVLTALRSSGAATLYHLQSDTPVTRFSISYEGLIHNPPQDDESIGTIQPEGASLFTSSYWYPVVEQELFTYHMKVSLPPDWTPVTNARLLSQSGSEFEFMEQTEQEDIYLIAAPFVVYQLEKNGIQYQVLLRQEDAQLAGVYLDLTPRYLEQYQRQIGSYPFSQFSVVENFWETGFGMPSFTLLGSSVMRLPFILNSSLPHEILHCWWGNGVFVDFSLGNWSEGLTTYQADYWQQRLVGADKAYRLGRLVEYNDFVTRNPLREFALVDFKGRHDSASQAIGYGKSLMFFEMLENSVGTFQFTRSLQSFYQSHLSQRASYLDIKNSFEKTTGRNLETFFKQWWTQKGAPQIELVSASKSATLMQWKLSLYVGMRGNYTLDIPIRISGASRSEVRTVQLREGVRQFTFDLKYEPLSVEIDPDFRIFRHLYPEERPLTLSSVFGRNKLQVRTSAYQNEAQNIPELWKNRFKGQVEVREFNSSLPTESTIIIGRDPKVLKLMADLTTSMGTNIEVTEQGVFKVGDKIYDLKTHDIALLIPHPLDAQLPLLWLSLADETEFTQWLPRLSHYGTFGYLVFEKREVPNKGSLPSGKSPLKKDF